MNGLKKEIRLNVKALMTAAVEKNLFTDGEIAKEIGVSQTQIWRAKNGENTPGTTFIAGVLVAFGGPFEKYFYLDGQQQSERVQA